MRNLDDQQARQAPGAPGAAGILLRTEAFSGTIDRMKQRHDNPLSAVIEDMSSPVEAVIGGRPTLLFGTNSYLGLNFHSRTIEAVVATRHLGTGSTASRVADRLHLVPPFSVSAPHTAHQIEIALEAFREVSQLPKIA